MPAPPPLLQPRPRHGAGGVATAAEECRLSRLPRYATRHRPRDVGGTGSYISGRTRSAPCAPMSAASRRRIMSQVDSEMEYTMELGAAMAVAGIALVASVAVVVVWQALATWRTRIAVTREEAYRRLAQQTAQELQEINE